MHGVPSVADGAPEPTDGDAVRTTPAHATEDQAHQSGPGGSLGTQGPFQTLPDSALEKTNDIDAGQITGVLNVGQEWRIHFLYCTKILTTRSEWERDSCDLI